MSTRIILVDDHARSRAGPRSIPKSDDPEADLAEAGAGAAAIQRAGKLKPNWKVIISIGYDTELAGHSIPTQFGVCAQTHSLPNRFPLFKLLAWVSSHV